MQRMEHIRRSIRGQREGNNAPAIPQHRQNIPAIPQEYCVATTHEDRSLLHDNGPGDPNRLLIFATDEGLDVLRPSDHCIADGTFEVGPALFFQVSQFIRCTMIELYPVFLHCFPIKSKRKYSSICKDIMPTDYEQRGQLVL